MAVKYSDCEGHMIYTCFPHVVKWFSITAWNWVTGQWSLSNSRAVLDEKNRLPKIAAPLRDPVMLSCYSHFFSPSLSLLRPCNILCGNRRVTLQPNGGGSRVTWKRNLWQYWALFRTSQAHPSWILLTFTYLHFFPAGHGIYTVFCSQVWIISEKK